jgi:hypothetical protein
MKHFLSRLVDRVRGTLPRVEPIVGSRFASAAAEIPAATEFSELPKANAAPASMIAPQEPQNDQAPSNKPQEIRDQPATPLPKPKPESQIVALDGEPPPPSAQTIDSPLHVIHESLLPPQHEEVAPLIVRQTQVSRNTVPVLTATPNEKGVANTPVERKPEALPRIAGHTQLSGRKLAVLTPVPSESDDAKTPAKHEKSAPPAKSKESRAEQVERLPLAEPTRSVVRLSSSVEGPSSRTVRPSTPATKEVRALIATPKLSPLPEEAGSKAPIVHVTIGCIEVRAAPAPITPARKPSRRPAPALTLDAYLKSRKGGGR